MSSRCERLPIFSRCRGPMHPLPTQRAAAAPRDAAVAPSAAPGAILMFALLGALVPVLLGHETVGQLELVTGTVTAPTVEPSREAFGSQRA